MINRQSVKLALIALVITGGLALVAQTATWRFWELGSFDLLTVTSAPAEFPDLPIVIVGIDEPSFADLGQQWPWPRSYHARLIDELRQGGATVIAFDVVFANPSSEAEDGRLQAAISKAGNVVLAGDLVLQQREQFEQLMRIEPLHRLQQAGGLTGISAITPDNDQIVRYFPRFDDAFWRVIVDRYRQTATLTTLPDDARVKYLGPDHSFKYVSYYQALDAKHMLPPGIFRDKIVLIGFDVKASAQPGVSRADAFPTPFMRSTGWLTPGVEVQANFVANALLGRHITEASPLSSILTTVLALGLSLLGMRRWEPLRSTLTGLLVIAAVVILCWYLFARQDIWLPVLSAVVAPVLLFLTQGGLAFLHERQQRREIRHAFQHYVAPQVVDEITRHPENLKLGGELRTVTLLFTDLEGFTHLSESMNPTQVAQFLNHYFSEMTRVILNYGGTVDKFIGDAVMAFWGAPLDDNEQALHATRAAIDMQRAMAGVHNNFADQEMPEVHMRIGVHSGEAVVGNMGSTNRFNYTALGDNVNLASRLEGVNKQYGTAILLSETTAEQLAGQLPLLYVDRVVVKGKSVPINIYTPVEDHELCVLAQEASRAYLAQRWDEAEQLWQKLEGYAQTAGLASIYRERIAHFRQTPPAEGWDGTVILDKK